MTLWHGNLHRIIAEIDALMPSDQPANGNYMEYEEFRAFLGKVRSFIDQLVAAEGGRYSSKGDTERLRLAGVETTCTTGPSGLLRNWQNAARKKAEAIEIEGAPVFRPLPGSVEAGLYGGLGRDGSGPDYRYTEEACPGHVASRASAKVCARCGVHIDSLRPDDDVINLQGSGPAPIEPRGA